MNNAEISFLPIHYLKENLSNPNIAQNDEFIDLDVFLKIMAHSVKNIRLFLKLLIENDPKAINLERFSKYQIKDWILKKYTLKSFFITLINHECLNLQCNEFWCDTFTVIFKYLNQMDYKGVRDIINPIFQKYNLIPEIIDKDMASQFIAIRTIFDIVLNQDISATILPSYLVVNELRKLTTLSFSFDYHTLLSLEKHYLNFASSLPHWSLASSFYEYVNIYKSLGHIVSISGRQNFYPILGYSSATNIAWRLDSNTFKFPIRGFLPYSIQYSVPQSYMIKYILKQPYSRDLVCNILGLKKQHKIRCPLLEEALADIILEVMLLEIYEKDIGLIAKLNNYDSINYFNPYHLIWQHLSSQVIFFVLFQFCSFSRLIDYLTSKIDMTLTIYMQRHGLESNPLNKAFSVLKLFEESRYQLSWLLLQFISGSIQNTQAQEFLSLIPLFNLLYPESPDYIDTGLGNLSKPLPIPKLILSVNTNNFKDNHKRGTSVRYMSGACIWMHIAKKFRQSHTAAENDYKEQNFTDPLNLNDINCFKFGEDKTLKIQNNDYNILNIGEDISASKTPYNWPIPFAFSIHARFIQGIWNMINSLNINSSIYFNDPSYEYDIIIDDEIYKIDTNIYFHPNPEHLSHINSSTNNSLQSDNYITNYIHPLLCNAFSTSAEYFTLSMSKIVEFILGPQINHNPPTTLNIFRNDMTIPLSMQFLDSLSVHAKMSLIHNIVTSILKTLQLKSNTTYLSCGLLETYSRLLVYMEIESLGIKGFITHLLPNIFKNQCWSAVFSLLEMFNHRLHYIQPHYKFQMLSYLHSLMYHLSMAACRVNGISNLNINQMLQLHSCMENLVLHIVSGLNNFEIQPQISRFQGDYKNIISTYSEELNKVLVLTLAKAIHFTGGHENLSGTWFYDLMNTIMHQTPHNWSNHTLYHFPLSLGKFYQNSKNSKSNFKEYINEEFKNMLNFVNTTADVTNYLSSLLTNTSLADDNYSSPKALILCLVWKLGVERKLNKKQLEVNTGENTNINPNIDMPDYDGQAIKNLLYSCENIGNSQSNNLFLSISLLTRLFAEYLISEFSNCTTSSTNYLNKLPTVDDNQKVSSNTATNNNMNHNQNALMVSKYLESLNELIWVKGLIPLDRLLLVLILKDNPSVNNTNKFSDSHNISNSNNIQNISSQMALFIAQLLLLKPPDFLSQRYNDFLITYPHNHWVYQDWHKKHVHFTIKYPERYYGECDNSETFKTNSGFPVLFGNIYYRLIPIIDILIHRYLELPGMYKSLGTLLDRLSELYRYHPRPLSYLYSTLFYFNERRFHNIDNNSHLEHSGVIVKGKLTKAIFNALVDKCDNSIIPKQWYATTEFNNYLNNLAKFQSNTNILNIYRDHANNNPINNNNKVLFTLDYYRNLYQRLVKALDSNSPFPSFDWRFNEFSNETLHYIHVICIELLSLPANGQTIAKDLINTFIINHHLVPFFEIDYQHWFNAIALTLVGLPDSYSSGIYNEIEEQMEMIFCEGKDHLIIFDDIFDEVLLSDNGRNNLTSTKLNETFCKKKRFKSENSNPYETNEENIISPIFKFSIFKGKFNNTHSFPNKFLRNKFYDFDNLSSKYNCKKNTTLPAHLKNNPDWIKSKSCCLIKLAHALWLHSNIGQLSMLPKFVRERLKPKIKSENQYLYLCHLIGPFLQRFHLERTRCLLELTIEFYEILENVDYYYHDLQQKNIVENISDNKLETTSFSSIDNNFAFKHVDMICGFLYHIKYMFTGDGIRNDVEKYIKNYKNDKLRSLLSFICSTNNPTSSINTISSNKNRIQSLSEQSYLEPSFNMYNDQDNNKNDFIHLNVKPAHTIVSNIQDPNNKSFLNVIGEDNLKTNTDFL